MKILESTVVPKKIYSLFTYGERTNMVGRNEKVDIVITDGNPKSVSKEHVLLINDGSNILVRDLNSTNGTYIDDKKTKEGILEPGHTIKLGPHNKYYYRIVEKLPPVDEPPDDKTECIKLPD